MFGASSYKTYQNKGFEYLNVSESDEHSRDLVLLHGMFGGLSNYDAIISHLDKYNIYVPSIPLYDFCASELSIKELSKWLHTFLLTMEIDNPVLVGNSMGGHLALDYTLQHPQKVSALVLTGSSGVQERNFGTTFPRRRDRDYIREQAALTFYDDLIDEVIVDEIMEVVKSPSKLLNMLAIARDTHEYNLETLLPEISQQTLLIWGKNDEITPPHVARTFHSKLPNAQLKWIDKCGHAPMMEHPEMFAFLMKEFLFETKTTNPKSNSYRL